MIGIILYIIATILFPIAAIAHLIVILWKSISVQGLYKTMDSKFFNLARQIDVFANVSFPLLWDTIFRKPRGYGFGEQNETLSSALGKNQKLQKLSWFGWIFVVILYIFDIRYWGKGGHCINSIDK